MVSSLGTKMNNPREAFFIQQLDLESSEEVQIYIELIRIIEKDMTR
jgi:hypothetical protein